MKWLKALFRKKEEERLELSIKDSELKEWFRRKTEPDTERMKKDFSEFRSKLDERSGGIKRALENLESATLHNPNIPEKEMHMMEGNRAALIQHYNSFLDRIQTFGEPGTFCAKAEDSLKNLAESTAKNSHVLSFFLERELDEVKRYTSLLTKDLHDLKEKMEGGKTEMLNRAREDVEEYLNKIKNRMDSTAKIEEERIKLDQAKARKQKLDKEIEQIKQRKEYQDFERITTEKDRISNDVKQMEDDLRTVFSQFDKALRKYERVAFENKNLVTEYVNDPVDAVLSDDGRAILKIMDSIRKSVDTLQLKDPEKILQKMDQVDGRFLDQFVMRHNDMKKELRKLNAQIANNGVLRQLDDSAYKLRHAEEQIARTERTIDEMSTKMEKLAIPVARESLEDELSKLFDLDIKLGNEK